MTFREFTKKGISIPSISTTLTISNITTPTMTCDDIIVDVYRVGASENNTKMEIILSTSLPMREKFSEGLIICVLDSTNEGLMEAIERDFNNHSALQPIYTWNYYPIMYAVPAMKYDLEFVSLIETGLVYP